MRWRTGTRPTRREPLIAGGDRCGPLGGPKRTSAEGLGPSSHLPSSVCLRPLQTIRDAGRDTSRIGAGSATMAAGCHAAGARGTLSPSYAEMIRR